jgi:ATP-dependent protease HslVU (ClpYQ) peptidase subunit
MTCIVGLTNGKTTYLAADAKASNCSAQVIQERPKIFKMMTADSEEVLVGVCGSHRIAQILECHITLPNSRGTDTYTYLVKSFAKQLRDALKEHGHTSVNNNRESQYGEILICFRGGVHRLQSDFSILTSEEHFDCIGSGEPFARGAMLAMPENTNPQKRMTRAIEIAAQCCPTVGGPVTFLSMVTEKEK